MYLFRRLFFVELLLCSWCYIDLSADGVIGPPFVLFSRPNFLAVSVLPQVGTLGRAGGGGVLLRQGHVPARQGSRARHAAEKVLRVLLT